MPRISRVSKLSEVGKVGEADMANLPSVGAMFLSGSELVIDIVDPVDSSGK